MRTHIPESNVSFVEANGLRFGYFSEGEGPLVLLMHGSGHSAYMGPCPACARERPEQFARALLAFSKEG